MAFQFPDVKDDFIAPNGITYTWDADDDKWRVKSFTAESVTVTISDLAPADPKEGDLWFDSDEDALTTFIWTGTEWIPAAPPVSLDAINAVINSALIVQEDLVDRVGAGEVIQSSVISQVDTLVNKVDALEGTVIDGKWAAESRSNPREGGFDITKNGLQSMSDWSADYLRVHRTDSTGKTFTFAEVSTGDYIRIGAPASTAVYRITEVISGSLDWQTFAVELANATGTPIPDLVYDFEFLPSFDPSAYASIAYVDAQDDLDVKLAAVNEVTTTFRIKSDGKTLISTGTAGELALYHVKDPTDGSAEWAATKGYVDTQIDAIPEINLDNYATEDYVDNKVSDYLLLTGGSLSGTLNGQLFKSVRTTGYAFEVKPGDTTKAFIRTDGTSKLSTLTIESPMANGAERAFEIKGRMADGTTVSKDFFYMYTNNDGTPSAMNYKGKMDNEHNLVTKGYVDNAITTGGSAVPVGSIMIWMNSTAPPGWFKLQGGSFSTTTYPQLHAYLQGTHGYTNGRLPNWSGYYPGEYGDHLTHDLGSKQGYKTGKPSAGAPRSSNSIPTGATRTFNATGNTNAYSAGHAKLNIDENWDNTTRPKTVVVHYIIKHD